MSGVEPAGWKELFSQEARGIQDFDFHFQVPSQPSALSEDLVGLPASISPPLKEDQANVITCSVLWEWPNRAMGGNSGREGPGRVASPLILSLSSLTATIIITWRDGLEVVRLG